MCTEKKKKRKRVGKKKKKKTCMPALHTKTQACV